MDIIDPQITCRFQVDRLPNTAAGGIQAGIQTLMPVLLSSRLDRIGLIYHTNTQIILPLDQEGRNIQLEGRIATSVSADRVAIYIDHRLKIHRTELKQDLSTLHFYRNGKATTIPHNGMNLIHWPNTACSALIAERHSNGFIKLITRLVPTFCKTCIAIVESEFPYAIHIIEGIPHKIRAGMLRAGNTESYLFVHNLLLCFNTSLKTDFATPASKAVFSSVFLKRGRQAAPFLILEYA